jgi:hypothetical protein
MVPMLRELSAAECEGLLHRNRVCRIAIRDGEESYLVPISYAFADGALYGHCPPGHKLTLLRQSPRVALLVDEIRNLSIWKSVMVRGEWEELTTRQGRYRARMLLLAAFEGSLWGVAAGHGHRTTLTGSTLFRIRADEITGRAQGAGNSG